MRTLQAITIGPALAGLMLATTAPALPHRGIAAGPIVYVSAGTPSEFVFTLSSSSVRVGAVTFRVTDGGAVAHSFKICSSPNRGMRDSCAGAHTPVISPGGSATLRVTFRDAGVYEYLCAVPGQAAAGMRGILNVSP